MKHQHRQHLWFTDAVMEEFRKLDLHDIGIELGEIDFSFASFPRNGRTKIAFSGLGPGSIDFSQALFPGSVELSQKGDTECLSSFSFRGATFEGSLRLDGIKFGTVPDLVGTEFRKHLDLSEVSFGSQLTHREKRQEENRGATVML